MGPASSQLPGRTACPRGGRRRVVVFVGPSLRPGPRPDEGWWDWRPPVRQGELYRAARLRPAAIGVIDGYFEVTPTVWHKEILWAMAQGIHVYGAASIGALRAAELGSIRHAGGRPHLSGFPGRGIAGRR